MARFTVKVRQEKFGISTINRIKVIGRITFKSKGERLNLNKRDCVFRILPGDYSAEEMANAINEVKKESYDLAKSIKKNEGVDLQKALNKMARKGLLDSDNRFI